jgi:hypothetical protein
MKSIQEGDRRYLTREEFFAFLEEDRRRWEQHREEDRKKWEENQRKWEENQRVIESLERTIKRGLSKIGARLRVKLEGFSRELINLFLARNGIRNNRVRRLTLFDRDGKVFSYPENIEVDIFIEKPLVIGEITNFLNEKDKIYNFDRKARFIQERYGREARLKFIACLDIGPGQRKQIYRLATRLGIKILVK